MSDRSHRQGVLRALLVTLLMGAAAAAAPPDLRLVNAAKDQDAQQVRTLLSGHPDVNTRSEDGSTALLWAAHWNDLQIGNAARARRGRCECRERFQDDAARASLHERKRRVCRFTSEGRRKSKHADRNGRNAADDMRADRQRRRCPHAAGSRRRCERQRAEPESNRVDVGRGPTTSEGAPAPD